MASQITRFTIVCSISYSGADQRRHRSSASLAFVWGIHRWPMNSLHKGPVTWKMIWWLWTDKTSQHKVITIKQSTTKLCAYFMGILFIYYDCCLHLMKKLWLISIYKDLESRPILSSVLIALHLWRRARGINALRPEHNGRHYTDDIFKCIFLNENEY